MAGKTKTEFDDELVKAIEQPLMLVPVALGIFFAAQAMGAEGQVDSFFASLTKSMIIYVIFSALFRLVRPTMKLIEGLQEMIGETFVEWLGKIIKAIIVFVGAAAILDVWGVPVMPFLASLSLLSVAIALGAQDLFKNLIAGMTIIGERRFAKGDWIFVDNVVEGTVEQVSFRSTMVRRFDLSPVYVPNAKLADNPLTNFSRMTHRRINWTIALEYRTTGEQLAAIREKIEAYIAGNDDFAPDTDVATFVRINEFADSSVNLLVYCFTKTIAWGEWLAIKERFALEIKKIVEGEGAAFAFPSQSLYLESTLDGDAPPDEASEDSAGSDDRDHPVSKASAKKDGRSGTRGGGRAVETDGGDKAEAAEE